MEDIWKTLLQHKTGCPHIRDKLLQLLDNKTISNLRLACKSGRFIVDLHSDFWKRKLYRTPQHYFSRGEHIRIRRVLLENLKTQKDGTEEDGQDVIDDIKAFVGVMEECRLREKAYLNETASQTKQQAIALALARMKAKRTHCCEDSFRVGSIEVDANMTGDFEDPFRVAIELEKFGFRFWMLFWAKKAFGFKWPQKGHQWICEFIRPIIVGNCTGFLGQLLHKLDIDEINNVCPYILHIATFEDKPEIVKIILETRLWTGLDLTIVDSLGNSAFMAACFYGRSNCAKVFLSLLDQKELETLKSPFSGLSALQSVLKCVRANCHLTKKPQTSCNCDYEKMEKRLSLFNKDYDSVGFYDGIFYRRFGDCASFLEGKKNVLQLLMSVDFGGEEMTNNLRKSLEKSTCSMLDPLLALLSENGTFSESPTKKAKYDDNIDVEKLNPKTTWSSVIDKRYC